MNNFPKFKEAKTTEELDDAYQEYIKDIDFQMRETLKQLVDKWGDLIQSYYYHATKMAIRKVK